MASPRRTAADREREVRESAARRRRLSVRVGAAGVVLLFAGGIGTVLMPENVVGTILVTVVGIALVVAALLLIQDALRDARTLTRDL